MTILAELLMLKNLQLEINRQTEQLEDFRQSNDGQGSEQWSRTLERLHQRQGNVGRLVNELAEDFKKAQEQAGGAPEAGGEPAEEGSPEGVEQEGPEAGEDADK